MPVAKDVHNPDPAVPSVNRTEAAAPRTAATVPPPTAASTSATEATRATSAGSTASSAPDADAAVHLVRLCLDLQLDAMLLALGAAAAQPENDEAPPWRRWVAEDVHLACSLAADVIAAGATLPPMLGSDLDRAVPAAAVDNLAARYESMELLLADVARTSGAAGHVSQALARCQERLRELRANRLDHTPERGINLTYFEPRRSALPGEWLG